MSALPFSVTISCDAWFSVIGERQDMNLVRQLLDELTEYRIPCSESQASTLVSYLNLVIEKNKVMNLTRIVNPHDAITLHLVDSLLPLSCNEIHLNASTSLLDMGTGAGFPGVPLAVMTNSSALLVDSVGKKVAAVHDFCESLGLSNIQTCHARLEDLANEYRCSQDFVFARAVARTNTLIEYATPFLKQNALLVLEKGNPKDDELSEAQRAAEICGVSLISRNAFELPRDLGHREILIYQRTRGCKIKLPRRVGLAKNEPLGSY